jgi:hypothetical protein
MPTLERRWRRDFPGNEAELRPLREWLAGLLPDVPARDDAIMVAVELTTNAVKHTAIWADVPLDRSQSGRFPQPQIAPRSTMSLAGAQGLSG